MLIHLIVFELQWKIPRKNNNKVRILHKLFAHTEIVKTYSLAETE